MKMTKTSFDLPTHLQKNFKKMCIDVDRNMNEVIREIINKWLMVQENKKYGAIKE